MNRSFALLLLMGGLGGTLTDVADCAEAARIGGVYSSLALNADSGDLTGIELLVVPQNPTTGDAVVTVQVAEGQLPQVFLVRTKVARGTFDLKFTMPPATSPITYHCELEAQGLKCSGPYIEEHLRHRASYWQ